MAAKRILVTTAAVALVAVPMAPASASYVSAGVQRDGMAAGASWSWASSHSWNSGSITVTDTKSDGDSVYAQFSDQSGFEGGKHSETAGNGHSSTTNGLSFSSTNYNLQYVRLYGCVNISFYPDACTFGSNVNNPLR